VKNCVECKTEAIRPTMVRTERTISGHKFLSEVSGFACERCDAKYLLGPALARFELQIAAMLPSIGANDGASFRFMRKALGMKAASLAEILGVAPETISRWENGPSPIEPRWLALLAAMAEDRLAGRDRTISALRQTGGSPSEDAPPVEVGPVLSGRAIELLAHVLRGGYTMTIRAGEPADPATELALMELLEAGLVRHRSIDAGRGQWRIVIESRYQPAAA
jgi:transcriptional regulator with XRE-family HTH domain